ncbi:isoprenoid synthase domain-containing protein [Podospora didyma]|uniref:Terpene synthase n=1 Tax=Podospora didyma TaxID=330526 RepID=A0AAE0N3E6_9PEZI|nr:isoprenoid synthase domain-containing protein [Podospora didyma]
MASETSSNLITELKGQIMHVPDLLQFFTTWPSGGRNKYYKRLKARLDEITQSVYLDETMRKRVIKQDFAFFISIWYPDADWDELWSCALFTFWLFHTDDAQDEEQGSVSFDFAASCRYRQQVVEYTKHCLGLCPTPSIFSRLTSWFLPGPTDDKGWANTILACLGGSKSTPAPSVPDSPNTVFKEFGENAQLTTSRVFRELLHKEIKLYIKHCETEQKERLNGELSKNLEQYMQLRHWTSAVRPYGYITQIGTDMRLPNWLMVCPEMQVLWDEWTIVILIINDILSCKKELTGGVIHNAVPVMYNQGMSLDAVMRELVTRMEASRDRFDEAAMRVQKLAASGGMNELSDRKRLQKYIDGLRTNATGTIEFCKLAPRYGTEKYFNEDGSMDVVL